MRPRPSRPSLGTSLYALAATVTLAWAAFQNLFRFRTPQMLFDEPAYSNAAWNYVHRAVIHAGEPGGPPAGHNNFEHPPLAKLMFGTLQRFVGHPSVAADRLVAGTCTVLLGVVLAVWVGSAVGRWTGLLAAAFATVLPQGVNEADARLSRFGMLDPVAAMFMVTSVALGWWWWRSTGRRAWLLALATGFATGCASSAKENGFLAVTGCVVLLLLTARRAIVVRAAQAAVAGATAGLTLLGLYLFIGHPVMRVQYMLDFQSQHGLKAHGTSFAGRYELFPPWWTNFWFAGHGMTASVTTGLLVLVAAALVLRWREPLLHWSLAALVLPIVVHAFLVPIMLPYYYVLWQAPFFVVAALGAQGLVQRAERVRALAVLVGLACLAAPAQGAFAETRRVAELKPTGMKAYEQVQRDHGLTGNAVVAGIFRYEYREYRGTSRLIAAPTPAVLPTVDTVIVSKPRCNAANTPVQQAFLEANEAVLKEVYSDRRVVIYKVTDTLTMPSSAAIVLQPRLDRAKLC